MRRLLVFIAAALALATPGHAAGKPLNLFLSPTTATITEGQGAPFTLTKSGGNGQTTSAKVTTSDGSWSATVAIGSTFTVPTTDDSIVNGTRTIIVTATASTGATAKSTITELDNDVAPLPGVVPLPSMGVTFCANENEVCSFSGTSTVYYGTGQTYYALTLSGPVACNNATFGDPAFGFSKSCYVATGAPPPPPPPTGSTDVLSEGDSISLFWGGNHTGIYASTHPAIVFVGHAVGGSGLGDPQEVSTGNDLYPRQAGDLAVNAKVMTVLIGANNLNAVGSNWYEYSTPQAYADALFAWIAPFRAAGTKVAVGTVLPQCTTGNPESGADLATNTNRAALNPIIRAAVGTKIDAVIDFAADSVMGPDQAACDTTLYQPGGLHPTDGGGPGVGGQGKLEIIYAPVVDALLAAPAASAMVSANPLTGQSPGVGAADIITADHNVLNDLQPSWGTGAIPPSNAPDVVGAFRFICRHTNLATDDPTVFPGQPGKSHLHDQTGVYGWNASSNYGNLRTRGGGSGCNDVAGSDRNQAETVWAANRTPYWQPALLDGKGNVILADYTSFYYKRRPASDPLVSDQTNPRYQGKAVPLPNGVKFVFGGFPENSSKQPVVAPEFGCTNGAAGSVYPTDGTFSGAVACAKAHAGGTLEAHFSAPDCWDGVNLDSPDHRSHMAYGSYTQPNGYYQCDAGHRYVIPTFTYAVFYSLLPTDDGDIHFSSDEMDNTKPRGWSFHVDYGPAAWDPQVKMMWENGCIDKLLNCSGGDLGNGKQLKGAAEPIYLANGVWTQAWRNPQRLVPIPPPSTN